MKKGQIGNSLLLLLTATIWGAAFVAQSVGLKYVEPFTPPSSRSVLTFYHLGAHKNGCDDG